MSTQPTILIVEDDRSLREGVAMNLRMEGYHVVTAADGERGMALAFDARPDLIVLDVMMPGWSGLDILEELRKRANAVPVLILSARKTTSNKVEGLTLGADDYLTKPFDLPELVARIEALLRRKTHDQAQRPPITIGTLTIDLTARSVISDGQPITLSAREFDLLALLAEHPDQAFTREMILQRVWGWDYDGTARTVDNFVAHLRKKLGNTRNKHLITTVPRIGYKLTPPSESVRHQGQ